MSFNLAVSEHAAIAPYRSEINKIRKVALKIRKQSPRQEALWDAPADILIKDEWLKGKTVQAANITLTPTGCQWASTGGCTMCGEWAGSTLGKLVPPEIHVSQFVAGVTKLMKEGHCVPWIRIYQEGNYTNVNEIGSETRTMILTLASRLPQVERITVETMAKYVKSKDIAVMRRCVAGNVELEVGIGFEALDPIVRNICVNKGESIEHYQRAVDVLRENGCRSLAYVLLKPPFLTEAEAISEAVATVKAAIKMGFDAVSIEPVSIHDWSLVGALHFQGMYRNPWIWSVIEVARQVVKDVAPVRGSLRTEMRIGGYEYYPRPTQLAQNYHHGPNRNCSPRAWECIRLFNELQNVEVFSSFQCKCMDDWQREMSLQIPTEWSDIFKGDLPKIGERVTPILDRLKIDKYLDSLKKRNISDA